jgi:hypothetical protein
MRFVRAILGTAAGLFAALLASLLVPQAASAQLGVCGRGEAPIGWGRSNPAVPAPLCPAAAAAPPPAARDTYAGMAYHPDAADLRVIGNHSGQPSLDAVDQAALRACHQANPARKCILRQISGNGFLQVFRGDAKLYIIPEITSERARAAARGFCKQRKIKSCQLDASYDTRQPALLVHDYTG